MADIHSTVFKRMNKTLSKHCMDTLASMHRRDVSFVSCYLSKIHRTAGGPYAMVVMNMTVISKGGYLDKYGCIPYSDMNATAYQFHKWNTSSGDRFGYLIDIEAPTKVVQKTWRF